MAGRSIRIVRATQAGSDRRATPTSLPAASGSSTIRLTATTTALSCGPIIIATPGVPHHLVGRGGVTLNSDGSSFGDSGSTQDRLFLSPFPCRPVQRWPLRASPWLVVYTPALIQSPDRRGARLAPAIILRATVRRCERWEPRPSCRLMWPGLSRALLSARGPLGHRICTLTNRPGERPGGSRSTPVPWK